LGGRRIVGMFRGYGTEVEGFVRVVTMGGAFVRVPGLKIFRLLLLAGMVQLSTTTLGVFSKL
jgi:hypothetical protein